MKLFFAFCLLLVEELRGNPIGEQELCKGNFKCGNGNCVPKRWVCDGEIDCKDGSDEVDCPLKTCAAGMFMCMPHFLCIPIEWRCDGELDCADGGDERGCIRTTTTMRPHRQTCTVNELPCKDGDCFYKTWRCDGDRDCKDGSDELNCHTQILEIHVGNASECSHPGNSNISEEGIVICGCEPNYYLDEDNVSCIAKARENLIWATREGIYRSQNERVEKISDSKKNPIGIDYDYVSGNVFYSDVAQEAIYMCNYPLNGTLNQSAEACEVLVDVNITTPDGIAYDWVHGLLFWTDTGRNTISVLNVSDPEIRTTLFDSDLDEPRGIAVDPNLGLIFWTDWGSNPKVESAFMSGLGRNTILDKTNADILWPNGIALDRTNQRVYVGDGKTGSIISANYNGTGIALINSECHSSHIFAMAVTEEMIYFTDLEQEAIFSQTLNGERTKLIDSVKAPMGIQIYTDTAQPISENYCEWKNCFQLCLPNGNKTAVCSEDYGNDNNLDFEELGSGEKIELNELVSLMNDNNLPIDTVN